MYESKHQYVSIWLYIIPSIVVTLEDHLLIPVLVLGQNCGHSLVDFLQSEHSSLFSWCWSSFILVFNWRDVKCVVR